jgi:hypothetical protein
MERIRKAAACRRKTGIIIEIKSANILLNGEEEMWKCWTENGSWFQNNTLIASVILIR